MSLLIVCAAPQQGSEALVAHLAEQHERVLGVDGGAAVCLRAGVTPNAVIGDLDSLTSEELAQLTEREVPIHRYPVDKDVTDLDLAIDWARAQGEREVTLTACFSGRLDHTLAAAGSMARAADVSARLEEPGCQGWVLAPGHRETLTREPDGRFLSLLALTPDARISASGVRWPLEDELLSLMSSRGVSNRVVSAHAEIRVHSGIVLALWCEDRLPGGDATAY